MHTQTVHRQRHRDRDTGTGTGTGAGTGTDTDTDTSALELAQAMLLQTPRIQYPVNLCVCFECFHGTVHSWVLRQPS